jgi:nucleotide-binding universal stress UspA family protein
MSGANPAFTANDLQSALIQLEEIKEPEIVDGSSSQSNRFLRIVIVTTVNQTLNRAIADVAVDMAEIAGGKLYLLNVVPTEFDEAGLAAAGPMVTAIPLVANDNTQIIEDRNEQLAKLASDRDTNVETEIEVRRVMTESGVSGVSGI